MTPLKQQELITILGKYGMRFSQFSLRHVGDYLPTDADWNYKDVPHLNLVHERVDGCFAHMGDDTIASINMQKILGLRFPLTVFNYQSGPAQQTYFANFFVYQLIIETTYRLVGPGRTEVTTTYAIGSTAFWQLFAGLVKFVLKRNYDDLMSGDIPMRTRRGQLRSWGYTFKGDNSAYSFRNTTKIMESNLVAPPDLQAPAGEVRVSMSDLTAKKTLLVGRPDHLGLRLDYDQPSGQILVFPRTCYHEGANLDATACNNGQISCPWHGRIYKPVARLANVTGEKGETGHHQLRVSEGELIITSRAPRSA